MRSTTTFKKRDPVIHWPDKERGIVVEGPYSEQHGGVESYTVDFNGNLYVCAARDLRALEKPTVNFPKKLCITTGDILFADPSMAHIAAMYDQADRVQISEEIVHRYNRYEELLAAVRAANPHFAPSHPDPRYDSNAKVGPLLRNILSKCEDR